MWCLSTFKNTRNTHTTTIFSLIHSVVWGPITVKNNFDTRWFLLFVDDHTRLLWVFLMKDKTETCQLFQIFNLMIQTQFSSQIQILKTDRAHDYFNSVLGNYLSKQGIVHQSSCVLIHHNKMVFPNLRTATYLRLHDLYSLLIMFIDSFGERLSLLPHTLLIECHPTF